MRTKEQDLLSDVFYHDDRFQAIIPHNGGVLALYEGQVYGVMLSPSSLSLGVEVFHYTGYCMGSSLSPNDSVYQTFNEGITAGGERYLKQVAKVGNLPHLPEGFKDYVLSHPALLAA